MSYVIITGASIENLGAESMTCIAIEMAKNIAPDSEIIISTSDKLGVQSKINYKTCSYSFPTYMECHYKSVIGRFLSSKIDMLDDCFLEKILPFTKAIIDVSGYAFSTIWGGTKALYNYLNKLFVANMYGISYYIMPQSFGPFIYESKKDKLCVEYLMRLLFKSVKCLYVREKAGKKYLREAGVKNIRLCPDMVLLYKRKIHYSYYRKELKNVDIGICKKKSVAIIPNQKVIEKTDNKNEYILALETIASQLYEKGYSVYFAAHCKLDLELINNIKCNMEFIDFTDAGAQAFDKVVEQFEFVISSRYHASVHAYRNNVPVISLGWEEKYIELMSILSQEKFCYECHKKIIDINAVVNMVNEMIESIDFQKKTIANNLSRLRGNNECMELYSKE